MLYSLAEDLRPRAGASDYQNNNGEFPPNDPPVPTSGGMRSYIDEEAFYVPGTSTTSRRAIEKHKIKQDLTEYDSRR